MPSPRPSRPPDRTPADGRWRRRSPTRRSSQWGEPGWPVDRILPVRIDLARSAGTDFEQIVLTIRAALARVGRPLPAFDLAPRRNVIGLAAARTTSSPNVAGTSRLGGCPEPRN